MEYERPGYVNYDCRSGDVITLSDDIPAMYDIQPGNYTIVNTDSDGVTATRYGVMRYFRYEFLAAHRVFYAGRLVPCLPPEGETKL